jgi:polycystin 1L2
MRQLRIKSNLCSVRNIQMTCGDDYSLSNTDKRSFQPGWVNQSRQEYSSTIHQAFQYQSSEQLDTYGTIGDHGSYSGGGYVYEFRGRSSYIRNNLSELHKLGWIDNKTRAVFIQLNLYNPNVQLFTSVTFLTEFLSTGGIHPQSRFEPMNFYSNLFVLII